MANALPYTKMKFKTVSICGRLYKMLFKSISLQHV